MVARLARRLGDNPTDLASKIDPDVMRRTRYPVLEVKNEDGTTTFVADPGIIDGPMIARK